MNERKHYSDAPEEQALAERAKSTLDQSAQDLDAATCSRLNRTEQWPKCRSRYRNNGFSTDRTW